MAFDDLIVGSGLSALGTALALSRTGRRVLCLAGDSPGRLSTYPGMNVPCEFEGPGGLGNFWHGVIPLARSRSFESLEEVTVRELLEHFYPGLPTESVGSDALFVPYRPIRPMVHLNALAQDSKRFEMWQTHALSVRRVDGGIMCQTARGTVEADRAWIACGALGTPRLLERSGLVEPKQRTVSDHIIGYAGLLSAHESPAVVRKPRRVTGGLLFPCDYGAQRDVLYMPRPARFDFARLDAGIAKRAVFGLPTSRIIAGLAGRLSPGLLAEALYNKFGLFPVAPSYSVNYMIEAPALYRLDPDQGLLPPAADTIAGITGKAVEQAPFEGLQPTRRPELFVPGVHLHGSLTNEEREEFAGADRMTVVDASALTSVGPDHHSFRMMALAYQRAGSTA